jgi:imidazolonepropionase-like amidohydrolase
MAKYGADHIKISATGGVLSIADSGSGQQMTLEEMKAIVNTARMLDRKVAAHAHGAEGMKDALRAGVSSIEHGTYLDDEAIALFKKQGAYLVPTIIAGKTVENAAKIPGFFPPAIEAMVEAGMPPIEAILAATRNAADLIGRQADIGSIQSGRYADLVAVKGDPSADIKLLQNVSFVMKAGQVYKSDGKPVM